MIVIIMMTDLTKYQLLVMMVMAVRRRLWHSRTTLSPITTILKNYHHYHHRHHLPPSSPSCPSPSHTYPGDPLRRWPARAGSTPAWSLGPDSTPPCSPDRTGARGRRWVLLWSRGRRSLRSSSWFSRSLPRRRRLHPRRTLRRRRGLGRRGKGMWIIGVNVAEETNLN